MLGITQRGRDACTERSHQGLHSDDINDRLSLRQCLIFYFHHFQSIDESDVPSTNEHFWHVSDMMHFDNVGFSKTVGDTKFLSCADCDVGPIGYHNISRQPKEYLINIDCARYRPRA